MFVPKKVDIDAGYELVALINYDDAKELGIFSRERVEVSCISTKKSIICVLEIAESHRKNDLKCELENGEIGLFEHAYEKLEITSKRDRINIIPAKKPHSLEFVKRKFKGEILSDSEYFDIIKDIAENNFSGIETTYFVLACTASELTESEVASLCKAMIKVGKIMDFQTKESEVVVDKHCIGGVPGNRTTMVIVPIIAAAGLKIPKSSSRSITSPAGTADTMEVFANVDISLDRLHKVVSECNGAIVSGSNLGLSPAEEVLVQVEHPLDIDSTGIMVAGILARKKSAGSTHVLIDIPVGESAKVKTHEQACRLEKLFVNTGKIIGLKVKVVITNGNSPIGRGIGPLYEAEEVMEVLKCEGKEDYKFKEKCLMLSAEIFEMAGFTKKGSGYTLAKDILESGRALKKFEDIVKAQGRCDKIERGRYSHVIKSPVDGNVISSDNRKLSNLAFILGAPTDKSAGLIMYKKNGDYVKKGDSLYEIFSSSELRLKYARNFILKRGTIFKFK